MAVNTEVGDTNGADAGARRCVLERERGDSCGAQQRGHKAISVEHAVVGVEKSNVHLRGVAERVVGKDGYSNEALVLVESDLPRSDRSVRNRGICAASNAGGGG